MARGVEKLKMPKKPKADEAVDELMGGVGGEEDEGEEQEKGEAPAFEAEDKEGPGADLTAFADEDLIAEVKARGIEHLLSEQPGKGFGKGPSENELA